MNQDELEKNQAQQFEENIAKYTLVGNLTHWRKLKDNSVRSKVLIGHNKILRLIQER